MINFALDWRQHFEKCVLYTLHICWDSTEQMITSNFIRCVCVLIVSYGMIIDLSGFKDTKSRDKYSKSDWFLLLWMFELAAHQLAQRMCWVFVYTWMHPECTEISIKWEFSHLLSSLRDRATKFSMIKMLMTIFFWGKKW